MLAAATVALLAAPALAGGVVGEPQPELVPFHVAPYGGTGSGAVLPNGDLLLASPSKSGTSLETCLLVPGGRSCIAKDTIDAYHSGGNQDSFSGTVEVVPTGGDDVSVVVSDCCYIGPDGNASVFDSTDGGRSWSREIKAGDIATIGAAAYVDGNIVVGSYDQGGLQVQAFSPAPTNPEESYATPNGHADGDTALANVNGGLLVASDDTTNTYVEYAKSGSGLNSTSSYTSVGTFPHELVVAASGPALLTDPGGSLTGGERLRFFNGHGFGPAYKVPDSKQGDDGYFAMQVTGNTVHVFFIGRRDGYDAFEESTTNGTHWTPLHEYASAIFAASLMPVLGPTGAGLLDETDGAPLTEQPILNAQSVHVAFATPRVHLGHADVLHGSATPRLPGQLVTLQVKVGGVWDPVKSTREAANGTFHFSVGGSTATYRAVVNDKPGYDQYGYSNAATVVAVA